MADADRERQITYTKFRLAELKAQRDGLDALIEYEEQVLAKLLQIVVE
jgi:hypothetical protein